MDDATITNKRIEELFRDVSAYWDRVAWESIQQQSQWESEQVPSSAPATPPATDNRKYAETW